MATGGTLDSAASRLESVQDSSVVQFRANVYLSPTRSGTRIQTPGTISVSKMLCARSELEKTLKDKTTRWKDRRHRAWQRHNEFVRELNAACDAADSVANTERWIARFKSEVLSEQKRRYAENCHTVRVQPLQDAPQVLDEGTSQQLRQRRAKLPKRSKVKCPKRKLPAKPFEKMRTFKLQDENLHLQQELKKFTSALQKEAVLGTLMKKDQAERYCQLLRGALGWLVSTKQYSWSC